MAAVATSQHEQLACSVYNHGITSDDCECGSGGSHTQFRVLRCPSCGGCDEAVGVCVQPTNGAIFQFALPSQVSGLPKLPNLLFTARCSQHGRKGFVGHWRAGACKHFSELWQRAWTVTVSPANVRIIRDTLLPPARIRDLSPCADREVVLASSATHGMAARSNDEEARLVPAAVSMGMPSPRPRHAAAGPGAGSQPESDGDLRLAHASNLGQGLEAEVELIHGQGRREQPIRGFRTRLWLIKPCQPHPMPQAASERSAA